MSLTPGTRLGPYEISAQIGVGGMGEVYQATDTNLNRPVAIKVLPESLAADAERLARFQREAQVLASLNHLNIASIYGLERAEGTTALVMELVEGPTLADRIAQGALPVNEALSIANNTDYTWIVNDHHFARLKGLVDDAKAKGARAVEIGTALSGGAGPQSRMFPPVLLLDVTDDMAVTKDEIFGPILPIVPYRRIEDAVDYVNARPRPLALYFFGPDGPGRKLVLARTTSGGVTINDTILHYAQEDLPFGGVGMSGMGAYHAFEGFKTMSHAKGVFEQGRVNFINLFRPPYGKVFDLLLRWTLR